MDLTAGGIRTDLKGKKCGASHIPKSATCTKGPGGVSKAKTGAAIAGVALTVGALSNRKTRGRLVRGARGLATTAAVKATGPKFAMKLEGKKSVWKPMSKTQRMSERATRAEWEARMRIRRAARAEVTRAGAVANAMAAAGEAAGMRTKLTARNLRLRAEAARRRYEPGYRKPRFDACGDGELRAGFFHTDKKCGASGIPDNAKCTKGVGRTIAEQKKRESVPKDKEYKRLRALEKEMDKNAPPKRNIFQKIGRKLSGAEAQERFKKQHAALKKKHGANSPEAWGGEDLRSAEKGFKSFVKSQGYEPEKVGANSPLANKLFRQYDKKRKPRLDACWKGYIQKGVKKKGSRTVPNCVPITPASVRGKRDSLWADGFDLKKTQAPA